MQSPLDRPSPSQVEAVMASTRVLGSLIAESLAVVEESVTMPQLRVLILTEGKGILNLSAVAADLGVHPSNATRTCDRLVDRGLLRRRTSPADRRQIELSLTSAGRHLVDTVMSHRRERVEDILLRLDPADRTALAHALGSFTQAAESVSGG